MPEMTVRGEEDLQFLKFRIRSWRNRFLVCCRVPCGNKTDYYDDPVCSPLTSLSCRVVAAEQCRSAHFSFVKALF